jgi:hypothetical protein
VKIIYNFMNRRKFIMTIGAATAAAAAGCSNNGNGVDTSSPEAVVESYYQAVDELESDSGEDVILNKIEPVMHSASPIPDLIEASFNSSENTDSPDENTESQARSLDSVSTEVVEEDVGEEALTQNYGIGFFVSETDIPGIVEENAIVEANVEYDNGDTARAEHVTATENGDWLIVTFSDIDDSSDETPNQSEVAGLGLRENTGIQEL